MAQKTMFRSVIVNVNILSVSVYGIDWTGYLTARNKFKAIYSVSTKDYFY